MTRTYARAPRGVRAVARAPLNYGQNITLVLGIRLSGVVAPMMIPGPMDGAIFETYVAKRLVPCLRKGDVVVFDGLGAHRSVAAHEALYRCGALVEKLPPYSPDYTPAEPSGSKVKGVLRAQAARTFPGLVDAAGLAIGSITPEDARGWFHHCGYRFLPPRQPP